MTRYHLELNSIGCRECRPAYLDALRAWLSDNAERLDDDTRAKVDVSPLRVFDNYLAKPPAVRDALDEAPKIGESLCAACVEHFAAVRRDLDAVGVTYTLVPTLVRGLDYYTRTTFEFVGPLENQNSTITGGGRYDYLVEEIGGPPTPGIGFGAGIERLIIAMEEEGVADAPCARRSTCSSRSTRAPPGPTSHAGSPSSAGRGCPPRPTTPAARSRASSPRHDGWVPPRPSSSTPERRDAPHAGSSRTSARTRRDRL